MTLPVLHFSVRFDPLRSMNRTGIGRAAEAARPEVASSSQSDVCEDAVTFCGGKPRVGGVGLFKISGKRYRREVE